MATEKKLYKLDVTETLRNLRVGESVTFVVAGPDLETTYNSLHTTRTKCRLPLTIVMSDDHMTATVTRNGDDECD